MTLTSWLGVAIIALLLLLTGYRWGYWDGRETRPERHRRTLEGRERRLAQELTRVREQRKQLG